ncbi:MAG: DUF1566 domain-containing protein [Thermodesulfobacteriota bacterium]
MPGEEKRWQEALDYVASINNGSGFCGFKDWHLPNKKELRSLIDYSKETPALPTGHPFLNVKNDDYWSSTSYENSPEKAWKVYMGVGNDGTYMKAAEFYVWPVRTHSQSPPALLGQTGQSNCYNSSGTPVTCAGTGQDGEIKAGMAWPSPRFSVTGDCVIDHLTGLMWTKNTQYATTNWQWAYVPVGLLNVYGYCGSSNWRLPNINELASVTHAGQSDPVTWLRTQGFLNVNQGYYWSSTSYIHDSRTAWNLIMGFGEVAYRDGLKDRLYYVWPVTTYVGPGPPSAVTNAAGNVAIRSAKLNGTVNPNSISTNYYFEWGTNASYGKATGSQSAGSGTGNVSVSANLTSLIPNTTYHFRLVAVNSSGTSLGSDMTFKTRVGLPGLLLLLGN